MVVPADLKWTDETSLPPGAKVAVIEGQQTKQPQYTLRIKFPADYKLPAHSHPVLEHVTVLSGLSILGRETSLIRKRPRR